MFLCDMSFYWKVFPNIIRSFQSYTTIITSFEFQFIGQRDSPELPETPEITETTENFMKVTKYLTKFKETLINYVWEKSHVKKQ